MPRKGIAAQKTRNSSLFLATIQMEITIFCIRFSKRIAKTKRSRELDLLREQNHLIVLLDQNPRDANSAAKLEQVKLGLTEKITEHKTKGSIIIIRRRIRIIRSRMRWYKHGERSERCSKCFVNLEQRSHDILKAHN